MQSACQPIGLCPVIADAPFSCCIFPVLLVSPFFSSSFRSLPQSSLPFLLPLPLGTCFPRLDPLRCFLCLWSPVTRAFPILCFLPHPPFSGGGVRFGRGLRANVVVGVWLAPRRVKCPHDPSLPTALRATSGASLMPYDHARRSPSPSPVVRPRLVFSTPVRQRSPRTGVHPCGDNARSDREQGRPPCQGTETVGPPRGAGESRWAGGDGGRVED